MNARHVTLLIVVLALLLLVSNYQTISKVWSPAPNHIAATPAPAASEGGDSPWYRMKLPALGRDFNILVLATIGFAVGIFGRFFGMLGTWIVTPALNIFGFPMAMAVGTDLTRMTGTSYVTAFKHAGQEDIDPKLVVLFVVGMAVGIEIGVRTLLWLSKADLAGTIIRIVYLVVLLGLTLFILLGYRKAKTQRGRPSGGLAWTAPPEGGTAVARRLQAAHLPPMVALSSGVSVSLWTLLVIIVMTGWLFGLLGVVGGLLLLPAMIYLIGLLPTTATGIDLSSRIFSGTYGCVTYALKGQVEIIAVLLILLGTILGTQACGWAVRSIRGHGIRFMFAIAMAIVGLSIVPRQFGAISLAQGVLLFAILAVSAIIIVKMIQGIIQNRQP